MYYKVLSICLCLGMYYSTFAQSYAVHGTVLNANTQNPIEGATIIGLTSFATTNYKGQFTINLKESETELKVSHLGYATFTYRINKSDLSPLVIYLEEDATQLEEVEVSGTSLKRKEQELTTISKTYAKEFLEQHRENSLIQTLQKIPGVSAMTIGSGQSKPSIRGLGFNRVVVVQNNIKHQAQQWGADHGLEIDQYNVENIQLIKGAASLQYGSDAIGGVLNIPPTTVPSSSLLKGEVAVITESNNNLLGSSVGLEKRSNNWFYKGRLTYKDYGDYKVPTNTITYDSYVFNLHKHHLRNTAGKEANASFNLGFLSDNIISTTNISHVYAKNGFFANAHGLEVRSSDIDYDASTRDIDLPRHIVHHFKATNNTSILGKKHKFYFDIGFQHNHREEQSEPVPHGYMPKPNDALERVFKKSTYSLNSRHVFNPHPKHTLTTGLNIEGQVNNIDGWGFLIPKYQQLSSGIYGYDVYRVHPDLHIQAGIRYDYGYLRTFSYRDWFPTTVNNADGSSSLIYMQRAQNKELSFSNISGSAGISYIKQNTTYKLNVGKSFRMPLANELASDGVNYHMYRYEKGNLSLDSEVSYQIDAEISYDKNNIHIGISPFLNFFDNYIYLNPTSNYYETLQIYEYNQSKVTRFGGELSIGVNILKNVHVQAATEYVYARQTSGPKKGFTLPFSPPLSTVFSAQYTLGNKGFFSHTQLTADLRWTATQNEIVPPEEKTDGYKVVHLSLLTSMHLFNLKEDPKLRLKINNIFNTTYYNHISFYRMIDVPEAGRNLSLALTIPF